MYRSKKLSKPQWDKHRKNKQTKKQTKVHYNHIAQNLCQRKNLKSTIGEKKDILCTEGEIQSNRLSFRNFASLV